MSSNKPALNSDPALWIITTVLTTCFECESLNHRLSHVLWFPERPHGKNNLCKSCGEKRVLYPNAAYWERKKEKLVVYG